MATENGGPAPAGPIAEGKGSQEKDTKSTPKEQKPAQADNTAAAGEKKLSNAELKKKAKEEKAARRAQNKTAGAGAGAGPQGAADGKSGKSKPKQEGIPGQQPQQGRPPLRPIAAVSSTPKEIKPTIPECFSHLSVARRIDMTQADKDVHPAVLTLGQHMSTFALSDSITRLEATLLAFKKVGKLQESLKDTATNDSNRSSTTTLLHTAPASLGTSRLTSSTHKSNTSQHVAPCVSQWEMLCAG